MLPTMRRVIVIVIPLAGTVGIVAAVAQSWSLAVMMMVVLLVAIGAVTLLTMRDVAYTRASIARVERRLESAAARGIALDEQVRADIADGLDEIAEIARTIEAAHTSLSAEPPPDSA